MLRQENIFEVTPDRPECHASNIVELPDGDLLASWFAGSKEGRPDVAILYSRLPQGSERWTPPKVLADTPNKSDGNSVLFVDRERILWLFYVTMYGNDWTEAKIKYKKSTDNGFTWSKSEIFRGRLGWMLRNKLIILRNGRIIFPVYDEANRDSMIMFSDNNGKSWTTSNKITSSPGNLQPTVVELSNGTLLAFMRSYFANSSLDDNSFGSAGAYIWQSTSMDKGKTWTPATPTGFKNPNSAIDMVASSSGNIILVFNDSFHSRTPLNIALSEDEGKTWPHTRTLEAGRGSFSYPCIIQTRNDRIHVTYSYCRKAIKHVVFDENWIKNRLILKQQQ